jgi:carbon monoxide dehydrogenase subunit G
VVVIAALFAGAAAAVAAPAFAAGPAPIVSVTADPRGAAGVIHGQIDIAAPRALVWAVMVDCARVSALMVNVKYCHVLQRDPAGRWDVREQVTKASLLPGVRTVMRSDYEAPHTVAFHRTDGDFKILEGEWRLEPLDGGSHTRVFYESRMSAPFAAPAFLMRAAIRSSLPTTLENLRKASEAEVGR